MLVGYVRVGKADGSQATDLQRDALRAAGGNARHIYEDTVSGKLDDRLMIVPLRRLRRSIPQVKACP